MKKKLLVFHPALAPYRVDFFNELSTAFNTSFYFNLYNVSDQKFDQNVLKAKCLFNINYLNNGFEILGRSIRFGALGVIKREKPDVILCSEYGLLTFLALFYRLILNSSVDIYTMSDDSIENSIQRKGLRKFFRNSLSKKIDGVILPSVEVCDWFEKNVSKKPNLLLLPVIHSEVCFRTELELSLNISNALRNEYNLTNKKVILFVGRLVDVKNLSFLLNVFSQLKNDDTKLVLVGGGDLKNDLKILTAKLNISNNVIFTGRKEGLDLYAWYNVANVFVLPSTYEPFGAVVNEALLSGCTVFCSKLAGASSLINKHNGNVFDPYNEADLLSCLIDELEKVRLVKGDIVSMKDSKMPFTFTSKVNLLITELDK